MNCPATVLQLSYNCPATVLNCPDTSLLPLERVSGKAKSAKVSKKSVQRVKVPQGGNQKVVLEVVRELLKQAGPCNTPATCPPGRPAIVLEESLGRIAERLTVAPDRKAERAREAVTGLVSRGVLGCDKGFIWLA